MAGFRYAHEAFPEEDDSTSLLLEETSFFLLLELETAFAELLLDLVNELLEVTLDEELVAFAELLDLAELLETFFFSLELETAFLELLDALLLLELETAFLELLLDFSRLSPLKKTEEEDLLDFTELLDFTTWLDEDNSACCWACSHSSKSSSIFCT